MVKYSISPNQLPSEGILFVDHETALRSGHLSHALVEYAPGKVLSFYSNCSRERNDGHQGFGWIEYRRSVDGARTWGDSVKLDYSWEAFLNLPFTVSCEKAVSLKENEVVLFCTRCINPNGWEPYLTSTYLKSVDGGETWREMGEINEFEGRIFDAIVVNGNIYVLQFCSPCVKGFVSYEPEHIYRILESTDGGESFHERGIIDAGLGHFYGALELSPDGKLTAYTYNIKNEYELDVFVSDDFGKTWSDVIRSHCSKRIRNPQVTSVNGGYILHGRSGCESDELPKQFVLYTSEDGIHWDDGEYIGWTERGNGGTSYYSNNLVLNENGAQRVLIQASIAYHLNQTNIAHWILDIL